MSVLLYILFTFVALVAAGVVYDLNRRRRGVPTHDFNPGMKAARADADARRVSGGH